MAVIGNKPAQSFNTIRKQTITGDGDSSYSLDHSISGPNDLEVFVNNVRQEPTIAYDASSQTLTMSEGIDSTDDFYVIYKAQTLGSIVHPKDQPLEATTGTFSNTVTGTDISLTGDLTAINVDLNYGWTNNRGAIKITGDKPTISFNSNANSRGDWILHHSSFDSALPSNSTMNLYHRDSAGDTSWARLHSVHANGAITTPQGPAWYAYLTSDTSGSGTAKLDWTEHTGYTRFNNGSGGFDATNNRYVVPESGLYYVVVHTDMSGAVTTGWYISIGVNGSNRTFDLIEDVTMGTNGSIAAGRLIPLNKNDYIEVYKHGGTWGLYGGQSGPQYRTKWYGWLVG